MTKERLEDDGSVYMSETQIRLENALIRLAYHDLAADKRDKVESCIELQDALRVLKEHCGYTDEFAAIDGLCD